MTDGNSLCIYGLNNDQKGMIHRVIRPLIIGRSTNCDVFISDLQASRKHTRFYRDNSGALLVEDLKSSNGTFLNGQQVLEPLLLSEGDVVRLGSTEFRVQRNVQKSILEMLDAEPAMETSIIKEVSSIHMPRLSSMKTNDYLSAIGVNNLVSDEEDAFSTLQKKTRHFATLFEISTLVQHYTDSDEMLSAVLDVILKVPGGDVVHMLMLDDDDKLVPRISKGPNGSVGGKFKLSKTVSDYVINKQCAIVAPDVQNDDRFSGSKSIIMGLSRSLLAVPIIIGNEAKGLIALCSEEVLQNKAEDDLDLLCVAASIVGPALSNLELLQEIEETQREVVLTMGAIGETRSKETGNHVKRVAEYSKLLGMLSGLEESRVELLKQASPMHDIGKVGIPDRVLNKPGKLNEEEWEIMKSHARLGYDMLNHSTRPILKAAAIVANEHHEKWNGSGYPRGLSGEDIHIFGRITAIADVFDALGSDRCYKKAWSMERILEFFKQQSGRHFDPNLVSLLFKHLDRFLAIQKEYKDHFDE
jgi:HD-GYP domain-containing protein (c-di-GMP phosphodiesterase class II)